MTYADAIKLADNALDNLHVTTRGTKYDILAVLQALDLIKFDDPVISYVVADSTGKSCMVVTHSHIEKVLKSAGYKIVREDG